METIDVIALTLGVAWASGINLYAAILVLGILGSGGYTDLPPSLTVLQDPLVLFAAGVMYFVEFFADKVPGIDTGWDTIHTFIRIPAGAILAVGAAQGLEINQAAELAAALLGGSLAATSHLTKAGTRVVINTSPEPVTNWTASIAEDLAVIGGLWAALNYPVAFIAFIVIFILLAIWLLPKLWRVIKNIVATLRGWFGGKPEKSETGNSENNIIENLNESRSKKLGDD
jgi:Domain of unknown function (DUF4126)